MVTLHTQQERTIQTQRISSTLGWLSSDDENPHTYSWIGPLVRTHKETVCRETERATMDLNIRMKSSRRGASNECVQKNIFSFFGELFLKIEEMCSIFFARHSWMRLAKSSNTKVSGASEVPKFHGELIFRKSGYCVFARKLISLVKNQVGWDRLKY